MVLAGLARRSAGTKRGLAAALWAEATAAAGSSSATGQLSPGSTFKRSAEHCEAEVCIHLQLLSLKQRQAAAKCIPLTGEALPRVRALNSGC